MIYLDYNATTEPLPEVVNAIVACMRQLWANPSSKHPAGQEAKRALAAARADVAALIGAQPAEIIFTSGATEANHHVLHGALARASVPARVLLSAIEHSGFLKAAQKLRDQGVEVELVPVTPLGVVDLDALRVALATPAALVSVMAANNETGVLQPVGEVVSAARAAGVPVHIDATQQVGRMPVDFAGWGVDLMSLSAHKFGGPKGCGVLVQRKGLDWPALMPGQQERGRRGGTENMPGILGCAAAARQAQASLKSEALRLGALRDALEDALLETVSGLTVFGRGVPRLPNTLFFAIEGFSADRVLSRLEREGLNAASGAACSSGGNAPSHVLLAMGVPEGLARGAVRISLGRGTDAEHLSHVVHVLRSLQTEAAAEAA
ncbi:cysteine desulfurase family protein [Methyloversatilis thermotolerans]|uniref:cysteine desulfurase family protein n=1 Tax=Methyloversatilis thermotolerans TaxID=1346290 RepID=UPI00036F5C7E|nr:cysteine desulfurase family protein [Methyloversatilis thermotolerans]